MLIFISSFIISFKDFNLNRLIKDLKNSGYVVNKSSDYTSVVKLGKHYAVYIYEFSKSSEAIYNMNNWYTEAVNNNSSCEINDNYNICIINNDDYTVFIQNDRYVLYGIVDIYYKSELDDFLNYINYFE